MVELFSQHRRKPKEHAPNQASPTHLSRTEFERDYDRVLFSTPVRRLADKTQVFPLDPHDSVRTRLTHSHEVSNLARSFGVALVTQHKLFDEVPDAVRSVPSLLAAAGLAHDLGNPPFGHQGEESVREWFLTRTDATKSLTRPYQEDLQRFDGNPQTLRLVTRLQLLSDTWGLNLAAATIGALIKYPVDSESLDKNHPWKKKLGVFQSELPVVKEVWEQLGLPMGHRHPMAYVVEACDDIAYSVLDVEDAVKKGLTSFGELMFFLEDVCGEDEFSRDVMKRARIDHDRSRKEKLSPRELNDISIQLFRVHALNAMMDAAIKAFVDGTDGYLKGDVRDGIPATFEGRVLCKALQDFALSHAYKHPSVVEKELYGRTLIHTLMDTLWRAVCDVPEKETKPRTARENHVWQHISENYRRVYLKAIADGRLPRTYAAAQLVTDMISGMTDTYVARLVDELRRARALAE